MSQIEQLPYIYELKNKGIIERKGPDNGGEWKIK